MNNKFALVEEIKNLAKNEYVSEIATNGPDAIFYKEKGKRKFIPSPFHSEEAYMEAIDGLIENAGLIKNKYLVEGRYNLPGNKFGRLHIVMPPASSMPLVTLAIKTQTLTSLTSIQAAGSFNTEISMFLKAAVGSNLTTCISGGTGAGKALHKDTEIPTPQGFKIVNELNIGDIIFDEKGNKTKILQKYSPNDPEMYEIEFKSGQKVKTSAGHLWNVVDLNSKNVKLMTTQEMFNVNKNFAIDYISKEVEYEKKKLRIDPYVFGAWLNDGLIYRHVIKNIIDDLKYYNLLENKHIPEIYKISSKEQRLELIAGLIDTGGSIDEKGVMSFSHINKKIVEDVREIVMSLGWNAEPICKHKQTGETTKYTFSFVGNGLKPETKHYILNIKKINDSPNDYFCFKVDSPSHLFLCTKEFIPTHNTTLLEAMTSEFNHAERIGVCEDSPELELDSPNTVYLNSTVWVPGMSDDDVADLSWVVKQINRMRVDKIIIGETRGKEFFDFITAANSGADGSLTTIHANDAPSAMKKMATFMYMAVDMSPRIINEMISQAVDIVIQLGKNQNGDYKIISIHEVTNAISAGDSPTIALNPLFLYDEQTNTWTKKFATDALKKKFEKHGYNPNNYAIKEIKKETTERGLPSYFKEGMD